MNFHTTKSLVSLSVLALAAMLAGCGDKPEDMIASAKSYMAKKDNKAAVIQIKNALQKEPNSAEARFLLGSALLGSGDPVNAEIELRKAQELKYSADEVTPMLAKSVLMQGKVAKLIEEFSKASVTSAAAKADLQTTLATAYSALGNKAAFQTALSAALAAEPDNAIASLMQVSQKMGAGDAEGASAQLDSIIAKNPQNADAWKLRGDLLQYLRNKPDEAIKAYEKAIELRPNHLAAYGGITTINLRNNNVAEAEKHLVAMKKFAPNHPQTRMLETQISYTKKDFKAAREQAQQLLRITPNNPRSLELAGGIELQLNSLVTAEDYLNKAVQGSPDLRLARRWLVVTYLKTGQAGKALSTLGPILNDKTEDAAVLSLAGEAYLQTGDVKKAEEYFAKASKLDPKDARKKTSLALTHLADGKADAAFNELQDIASADTGTSADMALISAYLRRREFDKALKAIDGLEKKQPASAMPANLRGRTQMAMGNPAAARKSYEAALAKDPAYYPAIASLASLDLSDKKPADARKRFEDLLAKNPKHPQALLALAELRAREGGSPADIAELINKAITANPTEVVPRVLLVDLYLQQKDIKQASSAAQNALAAMPDKPELLDAVGRTQIAAQEMNQAATTYTKLASLQPQSPVPLVRLADVHMASKNPLLAEQSLRKALDLRPDLLEAQGRLVGIQVAAGKFAEALVTARAMQKQRPREPVGYMTEAQIYAAQKNLDGTASAYRAGLKQVASPDLAVRLHATLTLQGKAAEADKLAADWTKSHPKDVLMPLHLAQIAMTQKNYAVAEKFYLGVVQVQPENAVAYNNLAWVAAQLNRDSAVGYAEKANTLVPNQPAFMDTLATLLADKQEYKKAIDLQTKVLGIQADNPVFKLNMAKIYAKAGEKDSARKQLDDLAKLGDKFSGQAEVTKLRATL